MDGLTLVLSTISGLYDLKHACLECLYFKSMDMVHMVEHYKWLVGNNFKKCPELTSQNAQNQFQQSFNIVDMSNIHGKHVHNFKT